MDRQIARVRRVVQRVMSSLHIVEGCRSRCDWSTLPGPVSGSDLFACEMASRANPDGAPSLATLRLTRSACG